MTLSFDIAVSTGQTIDAKRGITGEGGIGSGAHTQETAPRLAFMVDVVFPSDFPSDANQKARAAKVQKSTS